MACSCHICGQSFLDRISLARHQVEAHTMEKTFSCTQCDKTFKELRTLRLHLKIHNSEYPEQCSVCNKVFRTKWQLKQHVMDHGGERPYPCPECTFTCKTKQQLNEHRRKHSGEKAYSCAQCNTRFTYRNGLIKHTKLNRCPKKILTAEGETIVKKRTRVIAKDPLGQDFKDTNNNLFPGQQTVEKAALDHRILDAIQRRAAAKLLLGEEKQAGEQAASLAIGQPGEAGCLTIGQAGEAAGCLTIGQAGEAAGCLTFGPAGEPGGCLSLSLLNSFASSSSVTGSPPPTMLTTSADISSWAATLPAGTKVTVTHYDASKKHGQLELIATPTHTETIIVTQQKSEKTATNTTTTPSLNLPVSAAKTTTKATATTSSSLQLPVSPTNGHLPPLSATKTSSKVLIGLAPFLPGLAGGSSSSSCQLLLPHNPQVYHSQEALNLFSSIGVPNYIESFAVDPNEILHKEKKFIKSEPSTPTPKATEFQPVFHNIRVPTMKEDLLFKMEEPMVEEETTASCKIKQESASDEAVTMPAQMTTTTTSGTMSQRLLLSPEAEGISVNDIKKEVLSELFDCEPDYGDGSDDSFLGGGSSSYDDTAMHYSDESQEEFSSCLLSAGYDEAAACQESGDGSAATGQPANHNQLDLSLKLEALSPMSSFDSEPVPQTPEFYLNREDVFKAHFDMDLSQLLEDDLCDYTEDRTDFFRRLSCKEEEGGGSGGGGAAGLQNYVQLRSIMTGLRSKIY